MIDALIGAGIGLVAGAWIAVMHIRMNALRDSYREAAGLLNRVVETTAKSHEIMAKQIDALRAGLNSVATNTQSGFDAIKVRDEDMTGRVLAAVRRELKRTTGGDSK